MIATAAAATRCFRGEFMDSLKIARGNGANACASPSKAVTRESAAVGESLRRGVPPGCLQTNRYSQKLVPEPTLRSI